LNFHDGGFARVDLPWKARKQWDHDEHFEVFLVFICSLDSFNDHLNDFVLNSHKELIFDVNELLSVLDQLNVPKVNGLFDMFQHAHAPVGTASQKMVFDLAVIVGNLRVIVPASEGQRVISSQAGSDGDSELVGAFFLLYFF
jgi:hypothetical protein